MTDEIICLSDTSSEDDDPINKVREFDLSVDYFSRHVKCPKLALDDHFRAYIKKENLERRFKPLKCSSELIEKVVSNYLIVKQILSNLHWRDKLLCKHVCTTWYAAVQSLRREQLAPVDYSMVFPMSSVIWAKLTMSSELVNEPLVVMTFVNKDGVQSTRHCPSIHPPPCSVPCDEIHCLLDSIHKYTSAPKQCANVIQSEYFSYLPVPTSVTYKLSKTMMERSRPHLLGLFIPVIPDVKLHTIIINKEWNMRKFYKVVKHISRNRIFKGILVYVSDKNFLRSVGLGPFLNYFQELQPDIPFGYGGCLIQNTLFKHNGIKRTVQRVAEGKVYRSGNKVSISVFTIPKNPQSNECNFNMYSLVVDVGENELEAQETINEFSKRVPQFEYSAVIKLSSEPENWFEKKPIWEQDYFRAAFPNTTLIGCFGKGQLGVDHPPKPDPSPYPPKKKPCPAPRPLEQNYNRVYSDSTVFVYMGWGKILSNGPP
ncbi:uncharacterized protein LOC112043545 [Bicyclus anynana]|uniref:Uncharacterized protein LOC112043545 n=1 Tax=Bicyclus anynana TaxID=110368 RepID=A0A6J1MPE6_BICAN|nr:uncharacterized protein LOC112043545 [Bicyclus anynana]